MPEGGSNVASSPGGSPKTSARLHRAIFVVGLSIHLSLLAWAARQDSPTWDECGHFAAGLSHWHRGNFRLYRVNPPLVRSIACLPLVASGLRTGVPALEFEPRPDARLEFTAGKAVASEAGPDYFRLMTLARWGCLPFSALGASVCFCWSSRLYGGWAGITAAMLWFTCPNILGHGHLITPDLGATALGLTAAWLFWRWLRHSTWKRALLAGLALGLAELTKTTWLILFPLWPVAAVVYRRALARSGGLMPPIRLQGLQITMMLILALWCINLGYGFQGSFKPLGDFPFVSHALGGETKVVKDGYTAHNRFAGTWIGRIPVPLPEDYVRGIDLQKIDFERGMASYLNGQWRHGGWWYYYLYAMAIKVPLGTWALLLLSLVLAIACRRYMAPLRDELFLLTPAVMVVVLVSSQTGFSHHLRYVLPAFPFLFILMSKAARSIDFRNWRVASIAGAALAWSIFSSLLVYPHSLSYFNELVGGPKGGHYHLLNSNMDWGQDLLYLRRWLDEHPEAAAAPIGLVYDMPLVDPRQAGIEHRDVPRGPGGDASRSPDSIGPRPGWYAISVNQLHSWGGEYDYFLQFQPAGMAGYSLYIYHISRDEANRARAKLGLPAVEAAMPVPPSGRELTTRAT